MAVIYNPDTAPHSIFLPALRATTQSIGMRMTLALVRSDAEIESAIAAVAHETAHGLLAMPDSFTYVRRALITAQAAKHHLPAVYPFPAFATSGGLVAYGVDITDQDRQAASYIDQILKGTKPADLPVQQPTKFELDINLKTAKALGLTIPPALLASAAEVIE